MSVVENITAPKREIQKITTKIENGDIQRADIPKSIKSIKKHLTKDSLENYQSFLMIRIGVNENKDSLIQDKSKLDRLSDLKIEIDKITKEDLVKKKSKKRIFQR